MRRLVKIILNFRKPASGNRAVCRLCRVHSYLKRKESVKSDVIPVERDSQTGHHCRRALQGMRSCSLCKNFHHHRTRTTRNGEAAQIKTIYWGPPLAISCGVGEVVSKFNAT